MRTYEEIYDLFIDLIKGEIREVRLSFAELEMLDRKKYSYIFFGIGYIDGYYNTPADVIRKLCQHNGITQISDFKDNCFIYFKELGGKEC